MEYIIQDKKLIWDFDKPESNVECINKEITK